MKVERIIPTDIRFKIEVSLEEAKWLAAVFGHISGIGDGRDFFNNLSSALAVEGEFERATTWDRFSTTSNLRIANAYE